MTHCARFLAICLWASLGAQPALGEGVEITHLANEGFLLVAGEDKVLVDALFPGLRGYPRVPEPLRADLEAAEAPFDGVDLILATHFHGDHFGAREVARHLEASTALFVSTPDAIEKLEAVSHGPFEAVAHHPAEGERTRLEVSPGLSVTVLNLHHGRGRPQIQNLGFIIELGGLKILHVGDTEVSARDIRPYALAGEKIDIALLPGWLLAQQSMRPVVDEIGPARIIAMHLASPDAPANYFGSAGSLEGRVRLIRRAFPDIWIPITPLASRHYATLETPAPSEGG